MGMSAEEIKAEEAVTEVKPVEVTEAPAEIEKVEEVKE